MVMVYTTYKDGDDWGMVYDCFTHMTGSQRYSDKFCRLVAL